MTGYSNKMQKLTLNMDGVDMRIENRAKAMHNGKRVLKFYILILTIMFTFVLYPIIWQYNKDACKLIKNKQMYRMINLSFLLILY